MKLQTKIDIPKVDFEISHSSKVLLMGSCFSENIGLKLAENKFDVDINPFGILYNPASIAMSIEKLIEKTPFCEKELDFNNGLFFSFGHHGSFSSMEKEQCLLNINKRQEIAQDNISNPNIILITFGTSFVYQIKDSGKIVANCHKVNPNKFIRKRLCVEEIINSWQNIIEKLIKRNNSFQLIFTVSPIRHWKDGAHENQLSKSILLLAIDSLIKSFKNNVSYFPSYEIVLDELRDYRFYNEDMLHPSPTAINYIWERFSETFFSNNTMTISTEWQKIYRAMQHRVINPTSEEHKMFIQKTKDKIDLFSKKHPYINCSKEIEILDNQLNQF